MSADIHAQIRKCRQLLERGEQAVRLEAWDSLPRIQQSYTEVFDQLRAMLGDGSQADDGVREQLAELERRQRRLVYEMRKGQSIIKARLEDLRVARQRLGRFGTELPLFISASLDRSI
jgi:hypothetical protein